MLVYLETIWIKTEWPKGYCSWMLFQCPCKCPTHSPSSFQYLFSFGPFYPKVLLLLWFARFLQLERRNYQEACRFLAVASFLDCSTLGVFRSLQGRPPISTLFHRIILNSNCSTTCHIWQS